MWKNYLKIAIRNLVNNKVYSSINIGGLALGLACCITIGLFVWDELSYDQFHQQGKNIFRVVEKQNMADVEYDIAVTPGPLAPALKTDFAEITQTCRVRWMGTRRYKIGSKVVDTGNSYFTDPSFFSLFDFKLIQGDRKSVLQNPEDIIISATVAEKMFGQNWRQKKNLLGQAITFNDERVLKLVGIAENAPEHSHIQFEVLMSMKYPETLPRSYRWDNNDYHTYVLLNNAANGVALEAKLHNYYQKFVPESKTRFFLQPFHDIYLRSSHFAFDTEWSKISNIRYIRIFSAVGLIVLLIAIFNFINLSTARAIKRAAEVGVRKAIGAMRHQLLGQFLSESILMTVLAIALSVLLLGLFLPLLNVIAAKSIVVPFSNALFIGSVVGLALLVGLVAGIFPAMYLSSFHPIKTLKGSFSGHSGQTLRRSLVVMQFFFSVVLIIGTIVIYQQLTFLQNKNLGFDQSQLISVKMMFSLRANPQPMKQDLQNLSSIVNVASASNNLIDVNNGTHSIKWEGQTEGEEFLIGLANVDMNYLPTTGMQLLAGRNFDPKITTDTSAAYIINACAAKSMGWTPEEAIGKSFTLWEAPGKIIGVVQDFHFHKLTAVIEPFVLYTWPKESYSTLLVKTRPGQNQAAIKAIEQTYKKYEKQTEVEYEFVDEALQNQYLAEQRTGTVILYFSILAIFVSCLGLFGLATFTAEQRTKEIGIRKVLGASIAGITALLSSDFLKLVLLAIALAAPVAYYGMNLWLQDFAYRIELQWWMFVLAGVLAMLIAFLTVGWQSVKAALANPVKALKSE